MTETYLKNLKDFLELEGKLDSQNKDFGCTDAQFLEEVKPIITEWLNNQTEKYPLPIPTYNKLRVILKKNTRTNKKEKKNFLQKVTTLIEQKGKVTQQDIIDLGYKPATVLTQLSFHRKVLIKKKQGKETFYEINKESERKVANKNLTQEYWKLEGRAEECEARANQLLAEAKVFRARAKKRLNELL